VLVEGAAFFSSTKVYSSRNSFWSMVMLILCFMSVAALYCVYLVYKIARRGEKQSDAIETLLSTSVMLPAEFPFVRFALLVLP
jgi:hypothetical protein